MPWNFPFWQVMRYAIPTLIAGNVAVLKHSSACTGSALQIQDAFRESGLPENVFQCIIGDYKAGEALVQSDKIDAVSVTGSVNTGKRVANLPKRIEKVCFRILGGSDPFVVLEDADVQQTALASNPRLLDAGRSPHSCEEIHCCKRSGGEIFKTIYTKCRGRSRWRHHEFQNDSWTIG